MEPSEFWAVGDYSVVGDLWSSPGRDLVATLQVQGRDVVDLATGTGVTAIAAAGAGAGSVVGVDVTTPLLEEAERRAASAGVDVTFIEADVTALPLPDGEADLVTSTFGLIFAAVPTAAVREAVRLLRAEGILVFTSWSPNGLFGEVRRIMAEYFPDAPTPWHETEAGIGEVLAAAGQVGQVEERWFELRVASAEEFVGAMELYSAPIVLARTELGSRWPEARDKLVRAVVAAGETREGAHRVQVPYWVTTVDKRRPGRTT